MVVDGRIGIGRTGRVVPTGTSGPGRHDPLIRPNQSQEGRPRRSASSLLDSHDDTGEFIRFTPIWPGWLMTPRRFRVRSRSAANAHVVEPAAAGVARRATKAPTGNPPRRSRMRWRNLRLTRLRVTAFPTALETTSPTCGGLVLPSTTLRCATTVDAAARRPRTARVKSVEAVMRLAEGSTQVPTRVVDGSTVRRKARRDPCGDGRQGSNAPPESACATGNRGSWPAVGCWAGRCACSRGLQDTRGGKVGMTGLRDSGCRRTSASRTHPPRVERRHGPTTPAAATRPSVEQETADEPRYGGAEDRSNRSTAPLRASQPLEQPISVPIRHADCAATRRGGRGSGHDLWTTACRPAASMTRVAAPDDTGRE